MSLSPVRRSRARCQSSLPSQATAATQDSSSQHPLPTSCIQPSPSTQAPTGRCFKECTTHTGKRKRNQRCKPPGGHFLFQRADAFDSTRGFSDVHRLKEGKVQSPHVLFAVLLGIKEDVCSRVPRGSCCTHFSERPKDGCVQRSKAPGTVTPGRSRDLTASLRVHHASGRMPSQIICTIRFRAREVCQQLYSCCPVSFIRTQVIIEHSSY